jgi:hydroxymethylglutaryl-CoA reductase
MIENVIGRIQIPLGVASNVLVNGKEYFVPMATEEPSVVAAASNAARLAYDAGGVHMTNTGSLMQAQIQITGVKDPLRAKNEIYERKNEILNAANEIDPILVKMGGGANDLIVRLVDTPTETMVVTHLVVDTKDAMGANAVNTMAERLAPLFEKITDGKVFLRILTNLADKRIVRGRILIKKEKLGGEEVVDAIVSASQFAEFDPYRAATHNKGIMNGISAVVLATGNDTRAVESGAHAYAARDGRYSSLTKWEKNEEGDLVGTIEVPMAVGLVGGATASHPTAKVSVEILGVNTAAELAEVIGAIGLLQNLAAVRVLATEGVQRGHMSLHSRNVAISAGAEGELAEKIAEQMVNEGQVNANRAQELYKKYTEK